MQKTARKFVAQWGTDAADGKDVAISHNTRLSEVALYCVADFYF